MASATVLFPHGLQQRPTLPPHCVLFSGQRNTSYDATRSLTWSDIDKRKYYVYGPTVFIGVRAFIFPLLLLKTHVQMHIGSAHTIRDSIKHVLKTDGPRGFYKGFGVHALNTFISQFYITIFEYGRSEAVMGHHSEPVRNFVAGITAVAISQVVGNPVDVLANRVMASGGFGHSHVKKAAGNAPAFEYKTVGLFNGGAYRAIRHIVATEGIRGLGHGYFASVALHAPSSGIWWAIYGYTRPRAMAAIPEHHRHAYILQRLAEMACGIVSGTISAAIVNPLDVVRTRVQVTGHSISEVVRETLAKDGVKGFAKGMGLRMMLLGGNGAILVGAYELVKRLSRKSHDDDTSSFVK